MQKLTLTVLALVALLVAGPRAQAQVTATHTIKPGQDIRLAWDASTTTSTHPDDQLAGYEVAAFAVAQTDFGSAVSVKTWQIGTGTTFTIPAAEVPTTPRPFFVSVRARNAAGLLSAHSNSLGFQDPVLLSAPGAVRVVSP